MLTTDLKVIELEMAKEVLGEVFGATPGEVKEMIIQEETGRGNQPKPQTRGLA
jgi:hypothetical protein